MIVGFVRSFCWRSIAPRNGSLRSSMRLPFQVLEGPLKRPLAELMPMKAWLLSAALFPLRNTPPTDLFLPGRGLARVLFFAPLIAPCGLQ